MELLVKSDLRDENGEPLRYSAGQLVSINFFSSGERTHTLTVRVTAVEPGDGVVRLRFTDPRAASVDQRRTHFRLDTTDFKRKMERTDLERQDLLDVGARIGLAGSAGVGAPPFLTEVVNISGGGLLCLFHGQLPPLDATLAVRLVIPRRGVIECLGRVVRIEPSERQPSKFLVGMTFLEIAEEDREKIIDFTCGIDAPAR